MKKWIHATETKSVSNLELKVLSRQFFLYVFLSCFRPDNIYTFFQFNLILFRMLDQGFEYEIRKTLCDIRNHVI